MGTLRGICVSERRGTPKRPREEIDLVEGFGLYCARLTQQRRPPPRRQLTREREAIQYGRRRYTIRAYLPQNEQ